MPIDNEFILYGFIDRIQIDSDGILHVVDYKTTKDENILKTEHSYCFMLILNMLMMKRLINLEHLISY